MNKNGYFNYVFMATKLMHSVGHINSLAPGRFEWSLR